MKNKKNIIAPGEEIPSEILTKEKGKKSDLEIFLKENEKDHFNYVKPEREYRVSSGSLEFDAALDGGLPAGIHRFSGASESGKTSQALSFIKNFLDTVPNSKALYIKAEGRLGEKVKKRSKIKFAEASGWDVGTCFVYKSNVYDSMAQFIYERVNNNPENYKYIFVIDSLDSLMIKNDTQKDMDGKDALKVCGPNLMTKWLFKKLSLALNELGHVMIAIVQVIAKIPMKEKTEQLIVSGGGGNAAVHFSNFIFNFEVRWNKDFILASGTGDKAIFEHGKSNVIGHWVTVTLDKTDNEKSRNMVRYPIRYATESDVGGIWNELEIQKFLINFGLINQKASWFEFTETSVKKMEDAGLEDIQIKIQGGDKLNQFLSRPEVSEFWIKTLKNTMSSKDIL